MAPRRYTDVSPEEAERLKKQRDRMRLYRAKIKEKQKEQKEAHLSNSQHTQRQQNFKLPIPALPRSTSATMKAPSSKAIQRASELEIIRVQEAHELMKAWQAAPNYVPTRAYTPSKEIDGMDREELRRLQQRERQRKCRIKMKERYGRNADMEGSTATTAADGNGSLQSNWDEENDEIQILDSNEENDSNHKILRSYLQKTRECKPGDNGHHHPLEAPPVMCEYFESPNEKMLPKRRRGPKVGYHEQIEPNVTLLETSDGTLVPLRVLNQGYQDFDDLMEIELVELGNLEKQTQTPDSWDPEEELSSMRAENEKIKLENERLKQENEKLKLALDKLTNKCESTKVKLEPTF